MPLKTEMKTMLAQEVDTHTRIADFFRALAQPARVRLLLAIGHEEACVCHLEAALGLRQAYISQQLMALREAGLVAPRRVGRNIFYSLTDPYLLSFLEQAGRSLGITPESTTYAGEGEMIKNCPCPHCTGEEIECFPDLESENQNIITEEDDADN